MVVVLVLGQTMHGVSKGTHGPVVVQGTWVVCSQGLACGAGAGVGAAVALVSLPAGAGNTFAGAESSAPDPPEARLSAETGAGKILPEINCGCAAG